MDNLNELYKQSVLSGDKESMQIFTPLLLPSKLYRYRTFDSHWYSNIVKGKVFLSSPKNFNDPFDCALNGYGKSLFHGIANNTPEEPSEDEEYFVFDSDKKIQSFSEILTSHQNSFKDLFRIACFSEKLDSLPMWAHYAANHTGYVIEYDLKKLSAENLGLFYKVAYLPTENFVYGNPISKFPLTLLLQKSDEWGYESEWRIIKTKEFSNYIDLSPCISAVYLGCLFDKQKNSDELRVIQEHFNNTGAKLKEMYIANFSCSIKSKLYETE